MAIQRDIHRVSSRAVLGGVCTGIADFFDTSIALIRFLFIMSMFLFYGLPLLAYILAWICFPSDKS